MDTIWVFLNLNHLVHDYKMITIRKDYLVNILMIAVPASIIITIILYYKLLNTDSVKIAKVDYDFKIIINTLEKYKKDIGLYPNQNAGLQSFYMRPNGVKKWNGPYSRKNILLDPWGKEYKYFKINDKPTVDFFIGSSGRNGVWDSSEEDVINMRASKDDIIISCCPPL